MQRTPPHGPRLWDAVRVSEDRAPGQDPPRAWEADVVLADGSVAHLRPIGPDDAEGLHTFHAGQSEESVYLRFFAHIPRLSDRDVHRFTHVDHHSRVALVVVVRDAIAGIGRFDRTDPPDGDVAEVAFNVADAHRGKGIGSVLLEHLADIGREIGVRQFVADVLPQNRRMSNVFRDAGYDVSQEYDDGVVAVSFDIEPTEASRAVQLSREHRSEARSMHRVLHPSSVVVVGVSRDPGSVGQALFRHLVEAGFTGSVHAVNPAGDDVGGHPVLDSVGQVQPPADLAVVAVPAEQVLPVIRDCAAAGIAAAVVVSAGFAEAGEEGERRQDELLAAARAAGIRVLGPSSFGLMNLDPAVSLNASLAPRVPPAGSFGLFAQSGALAITVLASAERRGLGLSTFASAGNRIDISGNDLMQYWIDDERTRAVGLYLESMGNPRKFSRIARQLARVKPVVVVGSAFPRYGAPRGHRVRRSRTPPEAYDAMLRQSGVIRVENAHQLFDVAQLLVNQPLPAGDGVAVVTNSDALSRITADAVLSWGLRVARRPVSLPPAAGAPEFGAALARVLGDERVDSVVACFVPPVLTPDPDVVTVVEEVAAAHDKPVVATFLGMRGVAPGGHLPTYPLPEDAVRALVAATRYARWRAQDPGERVNPDRVNRRAAHDLVETALAGRRGPGGPATRPGRPPPELDGSATAELLAAYGIEVWPVQPVASADEAARAATALGLPAVVKPLNDTVRHQSGLPYLRADLRTQREVAGAFEALREVLDPLGVDELAVQRMAPPGVTVQITSAEDPLFGPVVGFGLAGPASDLLGDVAYRFPPLTDKDVAEVVTSVRAAPLLDGYRGAMPVDFGALHDLLSRVSVLADDLPEVASLRLDPVMCHPDGLAVLGARVVLAGTGARADAGRRALTPPA